MALAQPIYDFNAILRHPLEEGRFMLVGSMFMYVCRENLRAVFDTGLLLNDCPAGRN